MLEWRLSPTMVGIEHTTTLQLLYVPGYSKLDHSNNNFITISRTVGLTLTPQSPKSYSPKFPSRDLEFWCRLV